MYIFIYIHICECTGNVYTDKILTLCIFVTENSGLISNHHFIRYLIFYGSEHRFSIILYPLVLLLKKGFLFKTIFIPFILILVTFELKNFGTRSTKLK